jgi:hypothetical protein
MENTINTGKAAKLLGLSVKTLPQIAIAAFTPKSNCGQFIDLRN